MDKNKNDNRNQQSETMSKIKTNQDYNNQKPNPNDPNQNKNHQVGKDKASENKKREVTAKTGNKSNTGEEEIDGTQNKNQQADITNSNWHTEIPDDEKNENADKSSNKQKQ